MKNLNLSGLAAACLVATGCAAPLTSTFDPEARVSPDGRTIQVTIPQQEIQTSIDPSQLAAAAGGGLLMALIDAGVESSRAKKAEAAVAPLRDALIDFDFDARALAALDGLLARHEWMGSREGAVTRESTPAQRQVALDVAATPQVAFLQYQYFMSPNFAEVETRLDVAVAKQEIPEGRRPADRLRSNNLVYEMSFRSYVRLPEASISEDTEENVAYFLADNGKLAQAALQQSIDRLHWMLEKALALTPEQVQEIAAVKPKFHNHTPAGRLVEQSAEGMLVDVNYGTHKYWFFREDAPL